MAVTEVMRDPEFVETPERREVRALARGAPCVFCAEWIEPEATDAYRVLVSNPPREAEYAAHESCFESAKHPSVPLPS
jgi:hypothetical protein